MQSTRDKHGADLMLAHLEALFQKVRQAVTKRVEKGSGGEGVAPESVNPKGDKVKWFDLAADQEIGAYFKEQFPAPVRLFSEESDVRVIGKASAEFTVVVDPVDGSENFARQVSPSGMAVALIPAGAPINVASVQFALVGDFFTGTIWQAERGNGAVRNGHPIGTSPVVRLKEAMIGCELDHAAMAGPLLSILSEAQRVRAFGSAALALSMLGAGSLDAYLDIRGRLTPENFLASSLILTEAGGVITDPEGKALPSVNALTERYDILAAGTPGLHTELVQKLKGGE